STAYYSETAPYGEGNCALQVEIPCAPCAASQRCPVQVCREHLPVDAVFETARWLLSPGSEPPRARPNLSLYRSRFLSNGSLLYYPVRPEAMSAHYRRGLLGRMLWESALGLTPDPFLQEVWRDLAAQGAWEAGRKAFDESLDALE